VASIDETRMVPDLTKMQKIALLLAFYHSPIGAARNAAWEFFSADRPFNDDTVFEMLAWIINGVDENRLNWTDALLFMQGVRGDEN